MRFHSRPFIPTIKTSHFLFVSVLLGALVFLSAQARAVSDSDALMPLLQRIEQVGPSSVFAATCAKPVIAYNCQLLEKLAAEDGDALFFGALEAPTKSCPLPPAEAAVDSLSLWRTMNAQAQVELGLPALPPMDCGARISQRQSQALAAKFWSAIRRLGSAEKYVVQEIMAIDRILGEPSKACNRRDSVVTDNACREVQCVAPADLKDLATSTGEALRKLSLIEDKQREVSRELWAKGRPGKGDQPPELKERVDAIQAARQSILDAFPWLRSSEFQARLRRKEPMENALRAELESARAILQKAQGELTEAESCILSKKRCEPEAVRRTLADIPKPPVIRDTTHSRAANRLAQGLLDRESCLIEHKVTQLDQGAEIQQVAVDGGLIIASAGFGVLASSTRLALTGRGLWLARGARAGSAVASTVQSSEGVRQAWESCSAERGSSPRTTFCGSQPSQFAVQQKRSQCFSDVMLAALDVGGASVAAIQKIVKLRVGNPQLTLWRLSEANQGARAARLEASLKKALEEGEIVGRPRPVGRGDSKPQFVDIKFGDRIVQAIWKPSEKAHSGSSVGAELAVYEIDRKLGLNMVPLAAKRSLDGVDGSIHLLVNEVDQAEFLRDPHSFKFLDQLISQGDRNPGNILSVEGRAIAIDHGQAFRWDVPRFSKYVKRVEREMVAQKALGPKSEAWDEIETIRSMAEIKAIMPPKAVFEKLAATKNEEWRALLGPRLKKDQIEVFIKNRQDIISTVEELRVKYGDEIFPDGAFSPVMRVPPGY